MEPVAFGVHGARLHGEYHAPKRRGAGARPAVGAAVFVHGFNSNLEEFGAAPAELAAAGLHCLAFDQRGFGRSEGERGRTSWGMAVEDITAAADWLQGMVGSLPMALVGHSLGGAYALAAAGASDRYRCAVVAHPVDTLFGELNPVERAAYHVLGRLGARRMRRGKPAGSVPYKVHYSEIFVSREAAQAAKRDDILLKHANLANYRDALQVTGAEWARAVRIPVLCVGSPHDKAVKAAHSQRVFDALAGSKEVVTHDGGHSCFRDLDGDRVVAACREFLLRHLGGAPA